MEFDGNYIYFNIILFARKFLCCAVWYGYDILIEKYFEFFFALSLFFCG